MKLAEFFKHDFNKGGFYLYDSNGNVTYFEGSSGYWCKKEYDSQGNETYFENSNGYWYKQEFDSQGNATYYENSKGVLSGVSRNSVKKMSVEDIQKELGYKIEITE